MTSKPKWLTTTRQARMSARVEVKTAEDGWLPAKVHAKGKTNDGRNLAGFAFDDGFHTGLELVEDLVEEGLVRDR